MLAVQNALNPLTDRLQQETTSRVDSDNKLSETLVDISFKTQSMETRLQMLERDLQKHNKKLPSVPEEVAEYEALIDSPASTAIRFKDLFHIMGVFGVKDEISMACGVNTRRLAPWVGFRIQHSANGREYTTKDYRKTHAPVMIRGMMAVCRELHHSIETRDGCRCICGECRNLENALRSYNIVTLD